jgi:hypothetical protein
MFLWGQGIVHALGLDVFGALVETGDEVGLGLDHESRQR